MNADIEALPIAERAVALGALMALARSFARDGDRAVLRAVPETEALPAREAKVALKHLWIAASSGSPAEAAVVAAQKRLVEREGVRP